MILIRSTLDGSGTIIKDDIQMKASENATRGEALTITNAGLTKCAAAAKPDAIYLGKEDTSNGRVDKYVDVRSDDIFNIDVIGDASTVVSGTSSYCLTSDGLNLDATTVTGGHIRVLKVDANKKKAKIQFV